MHPLVSRHIAVLIIGLIAAAAVAKEPPNLLVIMTDEHNFRTLGCYRALLPPDQAFMWGPAVVKTPRIDSLASGGAICTSFYATTPVCSPSRGSFVSGRYPQNTPVVTNNIPLDGAIVTFAEILRRTGYATGYAGKWHLDGSGKPQWAPKRKFGFEDNRYMFN
ncbi:MAG: sulfatase-like hydrolase/transferase, partial [Phycisphaerae bacterium]|nr:sulfatase-like hydrolase/transferase [Phycisphaerae bacterium]